MIGGQMYFMHNHTNTIIEMDCPIIVKLIFTLSPLVRA